MEILSASQESTASKHGHGIASGVVLRPYQSSLQAAVRNAYRAGKRRVLTQLGCGGGKTMLSSDLLRSAKDKGNAGLILAPRRELIMQFHGSLARLGVDAGIIMAGHKPKEWLPVQVASFDTLHARAVRKNKIKMPRATICVIDEAHLSLAETRRDIIALYPDAFIIGLTATPARGDGRGLGEIYDELILGPTVKELTDMGYLVPAIYYAPSKPDLTALKLGAEGDYKENDLGKTMDRPQLVGDIVTHWLRLARTRKTVIFCVNCAHSRHVCEELVAHGVRAEHLDGETPTDEREAILARVESGATEVLCNVFVASYGLDIPAIDCIVFARPTKNITLYHQMGGRGARAFPGKDNFLVIDHAGVVEENGYLDDHVPWSLDPSSKVKDRKAADQQAKKEPKQITCGQCSNVFQGRRICPNCGWEAIPAGKAIPTHQADLVELKRDLTPTLQDKAEFMAQLKGYADKYRKKEGWAEVTFRDKFGESPRDSRIAFAPAVECGDAVRKWIISRNIRYAKGKGKAA